MPGALRDDAAIMPCGLPDDKPQPLRVRDWVAERTTFPADMAEVALAHKISNAVEAAYRRGDMIEKRRAMMAAWVEFLTGAKRSGKVVRMA